MSKKQNSPSAYADVKYVMDLALKKPSLRYKCKSTGAAVNFKQRCNRYRNLIREQAQEAAGIVPGYRAETAYDTLVIRQVNEDLTPNRKGCILIFDHHSPEGEIIDPETGETIHIDGVTNVIE